MMERKNKDAVTGVLAGEKNSKLKCEKLTNRTIVGIFSLLLIVSFAVSTEKGVKKEKTLTEEKADTSSSVTTTVTTSESPTTTMVTTSSEVTIKKKTTTTKAETKKEEADSSSSPVVTTTTTTVPKVETPTPETYNVGDYTTNTWVEYTTDTAPVETTVVPETSDDTETDISEEVSEVKDDKTTSWDGPVLNSYNGIVSGPSGNETYYNLNMSGVLNDMHNLGYDYEYWVRSDGVKMYGDYIMCAADLSTRPKGTIVETSLGEAIVCDTGGFTSWDSSRIDIATTW